MFKAQASSARWHLLQMLAAALCVLVPLYSLDAARTLRPTRVLGPVGLPSSQEIVTAAGSADAGLAPDDGQAADRPTNTVASEVAAKVATHAPQAPAAQTRSGEASVKPEPWQYQHRYWKRERGRSASRILGSVLQVTF